MRELHVGESLLGLDPDRGGFVNVFEDVDGLFDFAETDAEFSVGNEQPYFLGGTFELRDTVTHDLFGLFEPLLH